MYYKHIVATGITLCHQMRLHLTDDFVILKLRLFQQHTGSAGSFFTLKQYKKSPPINRTAAFDLCGSVEIDISVDSRITGYCELQVVGTIAPFGNIGFIFVETSVRTVGEKGVF